MVRFYYFWSSHIPIVPTEDYLSLHREVVCKTKFGLLNRWWWFINKLAAEPFTQMKNKKENRYNLRVLDELEEEGRELDSSLPFAR